MTTTSQVPAVIDWLVAAADASPALEGVTVFDGPQVPEAALQIPKVLWIGADPANLSDVMGESAQDFELLDHARTRKEDGEIICAAQDWSGDTANKTHRDAAAAIVAAVELLLRGEPRTGGPGDTTMGGLVFWSGVTATQWYPRQRTGGALMLVVFRITYRARLVTS